MHLKFFVRVLLAYDDIDTNEIPFSLDQIANATSTQLKGMIEVSLFRIQIQPRYTEISHFPTGLLTMIILRNQKETDFRMRLEP